MSSSNTTNVLDAFNDIFGNTPKQNAGPAPSAQSATTSTPRLGPDSVKLSPAETSMYAKLFKIADTTQTGIITPNEAVVFLSKSRLSQEVLGQIWNLSDTEKQGSLNQNAFFKALKYIAVAQAGLPLKPGSLALPTAIPVFDGVSIEASTPGPTPLVAQHTGASITSTSTTTTQSSHDPTLVLTSEMQERFNNIFKASQPVNGFIGGEPARAVFVKSNLNVDILSRIWNLVDPTGTGHLNSGQFSVAMLLITRSMQNPQAQIPATLPSALRNLITPTPAPPSAAPSPHTNVFPSTSGTAPASVIPSLTPVPQTATSAARAKRHDELHGQPMTTGPRERAPSVMGDEDRRQYAVYFDQLDKTKKGFLTGEEAYPFFVRSQLPTADLAAIWNLVDPSGTGKVNKEGFSTAMHLIKTRLASSAASALSSPAALGPKPLDTLASPTVQTSSIPPPSAKPTADLMDWGSLPNPIATPSPSVPSAAPLTSVFPSSAPVPANSTLSGSANALNPQITALSGVTGLPRQTSGTFTIPKLPGSMFELTELAERETDLNIRRAEVKQLQDHYATLSTSADELKAKKAEVDKEYKKVAEEKKELTVKMAQARAEYEAEVQGVRDLQEMVIRDMQVIEAGKVELAQVLQAVDVLKAEKMTLAEESTKQTSQISDMKKQIQELNEEANKLREELEGARAEVKKESSMAEVNYKLLNSAQMEYKQLKMDLQQEQERLEHEKRKATQFQQQASVQGAINEKQRAKKNELEQLFQSTTSIQTTQALMAKSEGPTPSQGSIDFLAASTPFPLHTKQVKSSEPTEPIPHAVASEALNVQPSVSKEISTKPIAIPSAGAMSDLRRGSQGANSLLDLDPTPNETSTSVPKSATSVFSKSPGSKSQLDELDWNAFSKPSATTTAADASSIKSVPLDAKLSSSPVKAASVRSLPFGMNENLTEVAASPSVAPAQLASTGSPKKVDGTPVVASSIVTSQTAPSIFAAATLSTAVTPSVNSQTPVDAQFAQAFSSNLVQARDTSTIQSQSRASRLFTAKVEAKDFADAFSFDTGFAPARAVSTYSGVSVATPGVAAGTTDFSKAFSATGPTAGGAQKSNAPTAAFGFDDDPFLKDPFTANGTVAAASSVDLNAAFGGGSGTKNSAPSAFGASNAFDNVNFDTAFAPPAPTNTAIASPGKGKDESLMPEVKTIMDLGFSKDQALNALEINKFQLQAAIDYLLESSK